MITKENFDYLFNPDIKKTSYDEIINRINERVQSIVSFMRTTKDGWWDYDTGGYGENQLGHFDPIIYKKNVNLIGENLSIPEPYGPDPWFPTKWLWEDYQEEFQIETEKYHAEMEKKAQEENNRREQQKQEKEKMIKQIKNKLTKEELKYIKFVK